MRHKAPVKFHRQQTNTQLFTGWMPFLSSNQQRQSTEREKKYHIPWTCSPQTHLLGLPTFSLTTKGTWLPWGGLLACLSSTVRPAR